MSEEKTWTAETIVKAATPPETAAPAFTREAAPLEEAKPAIPKEEQVMKKVAKVAKKKVVAKKAAKKSIKKVAKKAASKSNGIKKKVATRGERVGGFHQEAQNKPEALGVRLHNVGHRSAGEPLRAHVATLEHWTEYRATFGP